MVTLHVTRNNSTPNCEVNRNVWNRDLSKYRTKKKKNDMENNNTKKIIKMNYNFQYDNIISIQKNSI